ncbi:DUF6080 domain-containing protein [Winogradskyella sp.]|uniref:DUF6080 domain-containing protein n=1 Tax=Winogradskyella sp. TaxID=1883156 RepID=UPI003BAD9F4E
MNFISSFLRDSKSFLRDFSTLCLPRTKSERLIFLIIAIAYMAFAPFFVFNTFLLDHPESCCDTFLGFDSQYISRRGFANITAHPFMAVFSVPLTYLGNLIALILGYKAKTFFLVLFCTYLVIQAQIIIRRYLIKIIRLEIWKSNIITFFFAVFASNFALSISFDSFTFSFFLLTAAVYYFSSKLQNDERISTSSGFLLAFSIGGITITNIGKVLSVYFFDRISIKEMLKKQTIILSSFISLFIALTGVLIVFFNRERILDIFVRYEQYSRPDFHLPQETLQTVLSRFFGGPMLLPGYQVIEREFPDGPYTVLANYSEMWPYGITLVVMALLLWAIVSHLKNKLVLFITFNFLMDIVIHIVFEYGLGESFIYAGHWLFIFPILLGWLVKDQGERIGKIIVTFLVLIAVVTLGNNIFRFYEIYNNFGLEVYGIT